MRMAGGLVRNAMSSLSTWFTSGSQPSTPGPSGQLNLPGLGRPAENIVTVFAALEAWQNAISKVPMVIASQDGEIVEAGDLTRLLARPCAHMDRATWLRTITSHYVLTRMFAIAKVSIVPGGAPDELVPLNPLFLFPVVAVHQPTGTARAEKWNYLDPWTGSYRTYDPDQLIICMSPNPHAPLAPLSPMLAGLRSMQADLAIHESNLAIFLRGGVPSMVFETEMELKAEQVKERLQRIIDRNTGYQKHYSPLILDKNLKMSKASWSPVELQMLEGLRFSREELMMVTGTYPVMLKLLTGETGLTQGNSADQQWQLWWENEGLGFLDLVATALTTGVIEKHTWSRRARKMNSVEVMSYRRAIARAPAADASALRVMFNENAIPALERQRLARFEQMGKLLSWGYRPDEARDSLGLILADHPTNIGMIPMNLVPVESLREPTTDTAVPGVVVDPTTDIQATALNGAQIQALAAIISQVSTGQIPADTGMEMASAAFPFIPKEAIAAMFAPLDGFAPAAPVTSAPARGVHSALERLGMCFESAPTSRRSKQHDAHAQKYAATVEAGSRVCSRKIARYFAAQKVRVIARLNAARSGTDSTTRSSAEDLLKSIFVSEQENRDLVKQLLGSWTEALRAGWDLTNEAIGEDQKTNPFEIADPRIEAAISAREAQAAAMNDTTAGDLLGILRSGTEQGMTTTELGDAIADYYAGISHTSGRAMTASRTMIAGVVNDGQQAAARAVGGLVKIWIHGSPNESRQAHVDAEQKYAGGIDLDQKFVINGVELDAPGDAGADIAETANCTCCVGYKKA